MPHTAPRLSGTMTISWRRNSLRAFSTNAILWGLGNGLVSSSLIIYLANEYGVQGVGVSLILATPRVVGLLRLATPWILNHMSNPRRFASLAYLASALVLMLLPAGGWPGLAPSPSIALIWLVLSWTLYHLLEFVGNVALWDWIGRTLPPSIRGRYLGRRNGWLNLAQVVGMLSGAAISRWWRAEFGDDVRWLGYVVCSGCGAVSFALATIPLLAVDSHPGTGSRHLRPTGRTTGSLKAALVDRRFWRLLVYGGWFSFANGISGTAQFLFQLRVLDISYATRLLFDGSSQACQSALMPRIGKYTDRHGIRTCLVASQVLVACGLVFIPVATPQTWWLAGFAYLMWVAYAGINVALPKAMLDFTQSEDYASYAAVWFAWSQVVYAFSTLLGGLLFDWIRTDASFLRLWDLTLDPYHLLLWAGVLLRFGAVPLAARVELPREVRHAPDQESARF